MRAYSALIMNGPGASDFRVISLAPISHGQMSGLIGLVATVSPGASLNYSVQITCDENVSANGNWNNHDVLTNLASSANSNIAYPITAYRLFVNSYSSGSVNLGAAQWP